MTIKVQNILPVYEIDGQPNRDAPSGPTMVVRSHGIHNDRVELVMPDGQRVVVIARDLEAAIKNATNTGRW